MNQLREDFASRVAEETIQLVAERMRKRNIEVVVVEDGDQAREIRNLISGPDYMLGSVNAIMEE